MRLSLAGAQHGSRRGWAVVVHHRPSRASVRERLVLWKAAASDHQVTDLALVEEDVASLLVDAEPLEVEELQGIRVFVEKDQPRVEYLTKWKDGQESTWELAKNLSEDLIRDFDERWWNACKKADEVTMRKLLEGGASALAQVVDENQRSGLHFAAALGSVGCTKMLIAAGAEVDLQDREGFTPLHMAAGYMHTSTMAVLLEAGADPELKDNNGRDVVGLINNLRKNMPLNVQTIQRRLALESVSNVLLGQLYEEVAPRKILEMRTTEDGEREFLVQYEDEWEDEWLPERLVAEDVVSDYLEGLEMCEAEKILDMYEDRNEREFLIKWADGRPDSWEPEQNVSTDLIEMLQKQRPELFNRPAATRSGKNPSKSKKKNNNKNKKKKKKEENGAALTSTSTNAPSSAHQVAITDTGSPTSVREPAMAVK